MPAGLSVTPHHGVNVVLIGPPGAGKGTQAEKLKQNFGLIHVSTGEILRREIAAASPLGLRAKAFVDQGSLVPTDLVADMLRNHLRQNRQVKGFLFDGFPRTAEQAKLLDQILNELGEKISVALVFEVPEEILLGRIQLRASMNKEVRSDDNANVLASRLEVYRREVHSLIGYYDDQKKVQRIDGNQAPDQVSVDLRQALTRFFQS